MRLFDGVGVGVSRRNSLIFPLDVNRVRHTSIGRSGGIGKLNIDRFSYRQFALLF